MQLRLARLKPRQAFQLKEKTKWQCKLILFGECRWTTRRPPQSPNFKVRTTTSARASASGSSINSRSSTPPRPGGQAAGKAAGKAAGRRMAAVNADDGFGT